MRGTVAEAGSGREDLAAQLAGAIVPLVALTVVGAIALEPIRDLTAIRLTGVIVVMAVIILRPTEVITAMVMVITPLATAAAGIAGLAVGAMAGAAVASQPPPPTTVVVQQPMAPAPLTLGMSLTYLPGNCVNINLSSGQYYECGPNWFKPYFGSNGVYYLVVPAPY